MAYTCFIRKRAVLVLFIKCVIIIRYSFKRSLFTMTKTDKTHATSSASQTDKLPNDAQRHALPISHGSIADDKVRTQAIKPGAKEAQRDPAITSANPALSGKE
jgi:hypothetical protein